MPTNQRSNVNTTARIEVVGGQPVVFVGDRMFTLPVVNATNPTTTASNVTSAMESSTKQPLVPDHLTAHGTIPGVFGPSRASSQSPFAGLDLTTLKAQQALKKQELRTVEQTEVLQSSQQTEAWRAGMIEKKRCLIVELDALRKQITALESETSATAQSGSLPAATVTGTAQVPAFPPQFAPSLPQNVYSFPATNPYASMMMYQPPPFGTFPPFPATDTAPFAPATTPNPPHSPGSASRRSHAIEIKPPREETTKQTASALDPKSPTYEPGLKSNVGDHNAASRTPPGTKRSPWRLGEVSERGQHPLRDESQKLSLSSIDTTDFFPTNTHEHSSTRVAPRVIATSNEDTAVPSTPDKHWPASPWNEGNSGRSRNDEPAPKLTSWPEAFGKQSSFSTLRNGTESYTASASQDRAPGSVTMLSGSTSSNNVPPRTKSDQRSGTEDNWAFSNKGVTHVPSTYQEGYQAGYDHVGIPDGPEVLQGYIQGLQHFLADEAKKRELELSVRNLYVPDAESRTPSLRGLVAGSTPHDSAISMTFNRNMVNNSQENVRLASGQAATSIRLDLAHGLPGSTREEAASYTARAELNQDSRQRVGSVATYPNPAGPHQKTFPMVENGVSTGNHETYLPPRHTSVSTKGGGSQPMFGNPLQNRDYMTPLTQQRFYPSPKEMSRNGPSGGGNATASRPHGDHRFSGLDGAMDDLAEMVHDTNAEDRGGVGEMRSFKEAGPAEVEGAATASCFKGSGGKGKQKVPGPPVKGSTCGRDKAASPSGAIASSPRKSGEVSPAKAKLEQVTNKFRRVKRDDPHAMSPEDKVRRSEKWRLRFQQLKKTELDEIEKHRTNAHS